VCLQSQSDQGEPLHFERVRSLPVLLIVTFRPEFQQPWISQPQVSMLTLNRLERRDRAVKSPERGSPAPKVISAAYRPACSAGSGWTGCWHALHHTMRRHAGHKCR
jgi:hypothetical protein